MQSEKVMEGKNGKIYPPTTIITPEAWLGSEGGLSGKQLL